jgi:hypothetical protein
MFEAAPATRSIGGGNFHSLNMPVTRGDLGATMMEPSLSIPSFGRQTSQSSESYWGQHEQGPVSNFNLPDKLGNFHGFGNEKASKQGAQKLQEVVVPGGECPLEPLPFYVEKYTCFVSRTAPADLMDAIAKIFVSTNVDHETVASKHKMKGLAYDAERAAQCSFRVQLFQGEKKEEVVVEFQRRSGCVVNFHAFFNRTLDILGSEHVVCMYGEPEKAFAPKETENTVKSTSTSTTTPAPKPKPKPEPVDLVGDLVLDTATCQALFAMANSNNCDVQREALKVLAAAASKSVNQISLVENHDTTDLVALLEVTMSSRDDEVRRCASLFLTNLCKQEAIRSVVANKLLEVMLGELDAPGNLNNRETKRHVAAALACISDTHARELPTDLSALKRYVGCADFELRDSITRTLNNRHVAM